MLKSFRENLARFIAPHYIRDLNQQKLELDLTINKRVANTLSQMDLFEPVLKKFHGVFSQEYERPEDALHEKDRLGMAMWGYQQKHDPYFKYMTEWVMNCQGNATLKRGNPTPETILYGRAQISNMLLFVKEIGRLSNLYEEYIGNNKEEDFSSELGTE